MTVTLTTGQYSSPTHTFNQSCFRSSYDLSVLLLFQSIVIILATSYFQIYSSYTFVCLKY